MPSQEDIRQQLEALRDHRRNLALFLKQRRIIGDAYIPPGVANGIIIERQYIQTIKQNLHNWGVAVDDHPDDIEHSASILNPTTPHRNLFNPSVKPLFFIGVTIAISFYIFIKPHLDNTNPSLYSDATDVSLLKTIIPGGNVPATPVFEPEPDQIFSMPNCGGLPVLVTYYSLYQSTKHQEWVEKTGNFDRANIPEDSRANAKTAIDTCRSYYEQACRDSLESWAWLCESTYQFNPNYDVEKCKRDQPYDYQSCISSFPTTDIP